MREEGVDLVEQLAREGDDASGFEAGSGRDRWLLAGWLVIGLVVANELTLTESLRRLGRDLGECAWWVTAIAEVLR